MAYDFNSLTKQAPEASNRDKFYTDFEDVDPNVLHQISELTDWMRTKAKGSDVREVIAQLFERTWLEESKKGNANMEVAKARGQFPVLNERLNNADRERAENARKLAQKANKDEVTNVITPKGTLAYASLPTSGNQVGWYYYCPDGDGTHGAGNYVWNGTSWFFGGTGDEGYNLLKEDIVNGLIYEYNAENGYVTFSTGDIHELEDIKNTGFLPVKKGMIIEVKGIAFRNPDLRGLALYDTNKSFIEGYQYNENDVYKFEVKRDGYLNCTIVGNDITIIANQNGISNAMLYIGQDVNGLIYEYNAENGYVTFNTGDIHEFEDIKNTGFLPVKKGMIIKVKGISLRNPDWRGLALYDTNKSFIEGYQYNENDVYKFEVKRDGYLNCTIVGDDITIIANQNGISNAMLYIEQDINKLKDKLNIINNKSNPLSNLLENGGYTSIFNKISCIGDSLTEGVFEYTENGEVKYAGIPLGFEPYSYPSQLARMTGAKVGNYGVGGATAKSWLTTAACEKCFKAENKSQAYIIALGTNDTNYDGNVDTDIDISNYNNNADTFVGNYAKIIQKCLEQQPKAKVFVVTIPKTRTNDYHAWTTGNSQIKAIANKLGVYVLDVFTYSESHDNPDEYKNHFYLGGHRSAIGYKQTAMEYATYISWIIYNNPDDFRDVQYIGTDYEFTN